MTKEEIYTELAKELTAILTKYSAEIRKLPVGEQYAFQLTVQPVLSVIDKCEKVGDR